MDAIIPIAQDSTVVILGSFVFRTLIYLAVASIPFFLFWKFAAKRFEKKKVYDSQPTKKQIITEVQGSIRTLLIWAVMTVPAYFIFIHGYSPNKLGELDPWYINVLWLILLVFIHDTYFYWMHRWMHHPKLYKFTHAYHHRSVSPTPWAIFSFDVSEAVIHFSIGYVFLLFAPCHVLVTVAWFVVMVIYNVIGHLGFEFFPKFFPRNKILGISNTTTHHALHHKYFTCHYGLYFTFWDRVMGTERPDYIKIHGEVRDGGRI